MMVMDICFSPDAAHSYDWKYFVHSSHTGMNFVEVFSEDNRTISISSSSRSGRVLFNITLTQSVHIEVWRCPLNRTAKILTFELTNFVLNVFCLLFLSSVERCTV